jgi:hypothetical protein
MLSTTVDKCVMELPSGSAFAVQLILDARILHQMFPHKGFVEAVELLQSKMDPFEWSILDKHLAQNARNFVKRCTVSQKTNGHQLPLLLDAFWTASS